jgi:hypothetical protein
LISGSKWFIIQIVAGPGRKLKGNRKTRSVRIDVDLDSWIEQNALPNPYADFNERVNHLLYVAKVIIEKQNEILSRPENVAALINSIQSDGKRQTG